jgi:hypothetical protein
MNLFNFKRDIPAIILKSSVEIYDRQIPLNYVKGIINNYSIKEWTRYYDKKGNIVRYGDGVDDDIVREEKYKMLEVHLATLGYDSYMKPGHHEKITTLHFVRDSFFDGYYTGDTISYFGLFLRVGASWTDYFIYNHSRKKITTLYYPETINEELFDNKYDLTHLTTELKNKIKSIEIL